MDNIRFRNNFQTMKKPLRNQCITDTIAWLESQVRPSVKPEHLSFLIDFENALQSQLNAEKIPETWFNQIATTYGNFPFYEKFLNRIK